MTTPSGEARLTSVVMPVHNQADHIESVVQSHLDALTPLQRPFEFVLVTNNCTDDSPAICSGLAARDGRVKHLDIPEGGWGRAVRHGLGAAEGDVIGYTNTARTTPEMLVLAVLYASVYPGAVLKANRRIRDSLFRRFGSVLYNLECRALFDLAVWDVNGTPKLFPRAFEKLLELSRDDDLIDLEFAAICREAGYPVIELPILATVRYGGSSTTNVRSALRLYVGAVRLRRERRR
jgi:glycosyltransferase involved in cell wall biosynthesis